jgi:triphosphoribosyl-dephospho-CoA synthase
LSRRRAAPDGDDPRPAIALAATLACILETSAEKVGNVTPTRRFADARFEDFVASARALGPAMAEAGRAGVGRAALNAVSATRRKVGTNTNLGMALLFAPIAAAWATGGRDPLRRGVAAVLRRLTRTDAALVYRAIRLARPGGLGRVSRGDVSRHPTLSLKAAMALAASRDSIAAEYAHDFRLTFEIAGPALERALDGGLDLLGAIAQAHLDVLARVPDTLIARKAGKAAAATVSARARAVLRAGGLSTRAGRAAAGRLDRDLRRDGNRLNPGTSADLIAAALFIHLLGRVGAKA